MRLEDFKKLVASIPDDPNSFVEVYWDDDLHYFSNSPILVLCGNGNIIIGGNHVLMDEICNDTEGIIINED